ncbi:MAG: MarC family protein [Akkermansiaceae bacterium]
MNEYIQAFVTIVALVNPAICAQMFSKCVEGIPKEQRTAAAIKSVVAISFILLLAAVAGISVLNIFGISLNAFSCAGGGILVWIGASMINSAQKEPESSSGQTKSKTVSLAPLILFGASPGTITGVITVSAFHGHQLLPIPAILGVLTTSMVLGIVLVLCARFSKNTQKPSMAKRMISSYMGVIVIAMGVQFILSGIKAFLT